MALPLEILFDFETQIEESVQTLLENQGLTCERTDNAGLLDTPRVEVVCSITAQGPHEVAISTGTLAAVRVYDQFAASVEIRALFDPTVTQDPQYLRGRMRKAMMFVSADTLNAELTYLAVANNSFRQAAGARSVQTDEGAIAMSATMEFQVFIRATAWALF
jgi:hypothetical protein